MKKARLLLLRVTLVGLALYGAFQLGMPWVGSAFRVTREYRRTLAPDERLELVFVQHSAGAATRGLYQIYLAERGGRWRDGVMIVEVLGGRRIEALWNGPKRVQVNLQGLMSVRMLKSVSYRYGVEIDARISYR